MTGAEGRGDRSIRRRSRFTLACARAEPLALDLWDRGRRGPPPGTLRLNQSCIRANGRDLGRLAFQRLQPDAPLARRLLRPQDLAEGLLDLAAAIDIAVVRASASRQISERRRL